MKCPLTRRLSAGESLCGMSFSSSNMFSVCAAQAIVFCFSRREVESLALDLVTLDLTEDDEKRAIQTTFRNAIECLSQVGRLAGGGRGCMCGVWPAAGCTLCASQGSKGPFG